MYSHPFGEYTEKFFLSVGSDECDVIPDEGFLTPESCRFDGPEKLLFIDAPMGVGKTTAMATYIRRTRPKRLLCISCLPASVHYMARKFSTPHGGERNGDEYVVMSYLDKETFSWERYQKLAIAGNTADVKLAVCIDSVSKIPKSELVCGFDLVVIDDCCFTAAKMSSLIRSSDGCDKLSDELTSVLKESKKVVCMQNQMVNPSIILYRNMCNADLGELLVLKSDAPSKFIPGKNYYEPGDEKKLMSFAVTFFAMNLTQEGSKKPFMIFSTKSSQAALMCFKLRKVEMERRPGQPSRVLLINEDTVTKKNSMDFFGNPAEHGPKWDVVIADSVLMFGVSVDTHFVTAIDFIYDNEHIDWELHLMNRLRYRKGMEPCRFSYIEQ